MERSRRGVTSGPFPMPPLPEHWQDDLEGALQEYGFAFWRADTPEELALQMGVAPQTLAATLERYNHMCDAGADTDFCKSRDQLIPLRKAPFYAQMCIRDRIRSQEFVEAAKATGSGHGKIIFHEILPNILSPLIVDSTMRIGGNILQISGLSFIGLGVQPPASEWGSIMSAGQEFITTFWPMITFPGIAILLTVFAFNVMGDGLRDALDRCV